MALVIRIPMLSLPPVVEEELGLVKIFPVSGNQIKLAKCHLCNLMPWNPYHLTFTFSYLTAHAVGIADCQVEEITLAGRTVMGNGPLNHMSKVVELMAQVLPL